MWRTNKFHLRQNDLTAETLGDKILRRAINQAIPS